MKNSYVTVTDQFCGAGGSSIGALKAGAEVRLAMNHWQLACDTYAANHPRVDPICTDVSATDPRRYPTTTVLITSPECTNHSLAKGKPRQYYTRDLFGNVLIDPSEERSRATMWDVPRFAEYHGYELIVVENVVDAGRWRLWDAWLHAMDALGYDHQVVYYNSMFAWPTPQSRDRMYTIFWRRGNKAPDLDLRPLALCQHCGKNIEAIQTWKKNTRWGRYKAQYTYRCPICGQEVKPYYYAAMNAIDWTIQAERIGDRKTPLKPKTMERIKHGLELYGKKPLIVTGRYTTGIDSRVRDATGEPLPTQPGDASHAVLMPWMVETGYTQAGDNRVRSAIDPGATQTTRHTMGIVSPSYLVRQNGISGGNPGRRSIPLDRPLATVLSDDTHAFVSFPPAYIAELRGTSDTRGIDDPLMCVTASGSHHALLSTDAFLAYYYGQTTTSHISDPINTVTAIDRAGIVGALENISVDDLTFRMLQPHEIGKAMAFPESYHVLGTKREKVKQYGNAVTPPVMEMLIKRCLETL